MAERDLARTGVCLVRAEADAAAGLIITVTVRPDVADDTATTTLRTTAIDAALAHVEPFLRECDAR